MAESNKLCAGKLSFIIFLSF